MSQKRQSDLPGLKLSAYPSDFERFWQSYPAMRRVNKRDALKAWRQVAKLRPEIDMLLEKLEAMKATREWQENGQQYVPHPARWLRAGGWEHDLPVPKDQRSYSRFASAGRWNDARTMRRSLQTDIQTGERPWVTPGEFELECHELGFDPGTFPWEEES